MKKNSFYVIIERGCSGDFTHYDILPYLSVVWKALSPKYKEEALKDLQSWVDGRLKYQFWSRCQYEVILSSWPPTKDGKEKKKIDVYWQAHPNLGVITRLFAENEGITI